MKKLLLAAGILFFSIHMFAQWDNQWLIRGGKGKEGVVAQATPSQAPPVNQYINDITIGTLNIEGYYHPQTTNGKNCIFAIYDDGSYFDSRIIPKPRFFPPPDLANPTNPANRVSVHNFSAPTGKRVVALYTTRIYEGDDPPERIKVKNGLSTLQNIGTYSLDSTENNQILSANHNVLRSKDITLIINLKSLRTTMNIAKGNTTDLCTLYLNQLLDINGTTFQYDSCFTLMPVFERSVPGFEGGYPASAYMKVPGEPKILIKPGVNSDYLYLNLRPTPDIDACYHDRSGAHAFDAIFEIKDQLGNLVTRSREMLLDSYDPNYTLIDSICSSSDGKYVFYFIAFENTGELAAKDIEIKIYFPPDVVNKNCTPRGYWTVGRNTKILDNIMRDGNNYTLTMNSQNTPNNQLVLESCAKVPCDSVLCNGNLRLTVKLNRRQNDSIGVYYLPGIYPDSVVVMLNGERFKSPLIKEVEVKIPPMVLPNPNSTPIYGMSIWIPRLIKHGDCFIRCNDLLRDNFLMFGAVVAGIGIAYALGRIRPRPRPDPVGPDDPLINPK